LSISDSNPTMTSSSTDSNNTTTPTIMKETLPSCPNNCSGIGVCLPTGTCECPGLDPKTGIRWFTPPSEDCSKYGASAFGVELITFQISWALLNVFGFGLMITLVRSMYKENGDTFPDNVKGFCFLLITLGLFLWLNEHGRSLMRYDKKFEPGSLPLILTPSEGSFPHSLIGFSTTSFTQ
jgi:hypothetical protein